MTKTILQAYKEEQGNKIHISIKGNEIYVSIISKTNYKILLQSSQLVVSRFASIDMIRSGIDQLWFFSPRLSSWKPFELWKVVCLVRHIWNADHMRSFVCVILCLVLILCVMQSFVFYFMVSDLSQNFIINFFYKKQNQILLKIHMRYRNYISISIRKLFYHGPWRKKIHVETQERGSVTVL